MKKTILLYLIIHALAIASYNSEINLGDSVIRQNYSEREFFQAPKEVKNTYVVTQEQIQEKIIKMLRIFFETHLELLSTILLLGQRLI